MNKYLILLSICLVFSTNSYGQKTIKVVSKKPAKDTIVTLEYKDTIYYTVETLFVRLKYHPSHKIYKTFPDLFIQYENGFYHYYIGKFATERIATRFIETIKKKGYPGKVVKMIRDKRDYSFK